MDSPPGRGFIAGPAARLFFKSNFFAPPGAGLLVLGLRPVRFRCASAAGFAYRRVTFLCDKKVTKKTPSGALRGSCSTRDPLELFT